MNPLRQLRAYVSSFATHCDAQRWFGASFHVGVCSHIAEDVAAHEQAAARKAYKAEQADREAIRELREALADGKLDASDMPRVKRALASVEHSAEDDRQVCESLSV